MANTKLAYQLVEGRLVAKQVISLDSHRKPKGRRKRWKITPRFFIFLLCLLSLWVAFGFAHRYLKLILIQSKITRVEREIAAIESRNQAISEQMDTLQSDEYIEKMAREKLGLIMPGETVYIPMRSARPDDPLNVERRPDADGLAGGGY